MKPYSLIVQKLKNSLLAALLGVAVTSCGSETTAVAGISGTGIVMGIITGFGSIYVNGIEYDIDEADIEVDGQADATENELAIGMVVSLQASDNGDGTGVATSVVYDDVVEGPISAIELDTDPAIKRLSILGYSVTVNQVTTTFADTTFATLSVDDLVEISGFVDLATRTVIATRVEGRGALQVGSELEVKGFVQNLVEGASFRLNGIDVDISQVEPDDLSDLEEGLQNGLLVEVEGTYLGLNSIIAREIEGEDDDLDEIINGEGEISLQGFVTRFVSAADFDVNGFPVDASALDASVTNRLELSVQLEVEGELVSGTLVAEEIEFEADEAKFGGLIQSVDGDRLELRFPNQSGEVVIRANDSTGLEDEVGGLEPLTLAQLSVDDEVEIEAILVGGELIAKSIKRKDLEGQFFIAGEVQTFAANQTITLHGLNLSVDSNADYEDESGGSISAAQFFSALQIGDQVELVDTNADGFFDEIELDD